MNRPSCRSHSPLWRKIVVCNIPPHLRSRSPRLPLRRYASSRPALACDVEPPACCLFCCDTDWSHELLFLDRKDSSDWVHMDSHSRSGATRTTRRQDSTPVSWWGFLRVTGDPRDQPPLAEICADPGWVWRPRCWSFCVWKGSAISVHPRSCDPEIRTTWCDEGEPPPRCFVSEQFSCRIAGFSRPRLRRLIFSV